MRRHIPVRITAIACLFSLAACTTPSTDTPTGQASSTLDPDRPPEPVEGLPEHDPAAVQLELRTRMVAELNAILADVPQPIDGSSFYIIRNDTGRLAELSIAFGKPPHSIGEKYARAFDQAAIAHGWTPAGNIGWTNLRKGPFFLSGGDGADGVTYDMDTSPLTVDVNLDWPGEKPVPGLLVKQTTPTPPPRTPK